MYGHNVSHSNRKTNRRFNLNLQSRRLLIDGEMRRVKICTRCLRTMVKVPKVRKITLAAQARQAAAQAAATPAS
jgi:large subunit ribosomal protein L28